MLRVILFFEFIKRGVPLRVSKDMGAKSTQKPEELVEMLAGCDTNGNFNSTGNVLPQIKRPWGFNDWAPQTNNEGTSWWFRTRDSNFAGMRCTHQPSPWMGDYASFLVQPHTAEQPSELQYSPKEATFRPHMFKASLKGDASGPIDLEFTATSHAALMRASFTGSSSPRRISVVLQSGSLKEKDGMVSGITETFAHSMPKDWKGMFFVMKPITESEKVNIESQMSGSLQFASNTGSVIVALGTSFISEEQAIRNLEQEITSKSFDKIVEEGRDEWSSLLGRAKVEASTTNDLRLFYTNLWRAQLFPRHLHEVDAKGKEVHFSPYKGKVVPGKFVADSGFWDAYKTVYVLQSFVSPENFGKTIAGFIQSYEDSGWLPQWPSPDQSDMMVGTMGDAVLADAIVKSKQGFLDGFDVDKAYEVIRHDAFDEPDSSLFGRAALKTYIKTGYVPTSMNEESVALTLGYCLADAAVSNAATSLGKTEDAALLFARSRRYPELFSSGTKFFQPKEADGQFEPNFDPLAWRNGFTEGNAWHSRFDVPHDVEGLNKLFDGKLCEAINSMMTYRGEIFHVGGYGRTTKEMNESALLALDVGQYNHANQPVHHVLYIAKKAGCNELADKYLRKVQKKLYSLKGWTGDEDNGEMGAWYALSALGLYQMEGGRDEVILGSPSLVSANLSIARGKTLSIKTSGQSDENVFVQSIMWKPDSGASRKVTGNVIKFSELMAGGELAFELGATPKKDDPLHF